MRAEEWRWCLKDYSAVDTCRLMEPTSFGGRARATLSWTVLIVFEGNLMTNHYGDKIAFSRAFCASSTS